jgi:hypothetical protein
MSTIDSSEKGSWGRSPAQFYPSFTKMDYPKREMSEIERRLQRNPDLPKWDIRIEPSGR